MPQNYTFTLVDTDDVPLPSPEQQEILQNLLKTNERFIEEDLLVAFTNLADAWYDWSNNQMYKYNVKDGSSFTNHVIDSSQVINPVHTNGTQTYMGFFFNGTFLDADSLKYDPSNTLEEFVNVTANNVYRFSDWWMSQYFHDNFAEPDWNKLHYHVVNAIP